MDDSIKYLTSIQNFTYLLDNVFIKHFLNIRQVHNNYITLASGTDQPILLQLQELNIELFSNNIMHRKDFENQFVFYINKCIQNIFFEFINNNCKTYLYEINDIKKLSSYEFSNNLRLLLSYKHFKKEKDIYNLLKSIINYNNSNDLKLIITPEIENLLQINNIKYKNVHIAHAYENIYFLGYLDKNIFNTQADIDIYLNTVSNEPNVFYLINKNIDMYFNIPENYMAEIMEPLFYGSKYIMRFNLIFNTNNNQILKIILKP